MSFSLIHFLNFNLLILAIFPWMKVYFNKKDATKAEFSSSFISTSIFLIIYTYMTEIDYIQEIFLPIKIDNIVLIFISAIFCISTELVIFKIKYKKITFLKIENKNLFLLILLIVILPILEEYVFRACIYKFCSYYFDTNIPFLLLSSIGFGLNHIIYPKINILSKSFWGVVLGIQFIVCNNLFCCILTHIICNLFVYFMGRNSKCV